MISPKVIITGIPEKKDEYNVSSFNLEEISDQCHQIGFDILTPPHPFSSQDLVKWVGEVSESTDFLINIQQGENAQCFFKTEQQRHFTDSIISLLSQWTQSEFFSAEALNADLPTHQLLLSLLPYSWNIVFPTHLTKKEMIFSIVGCVTELYTTNHELIEDALVWPFRDVPSSYFAFDAIKKAKEKGIITGYKGDIFQPNGGMTRGELLYILEKLHLL